MPTHFFCHEQCICGLLLKPSHIHPLLSTPLKNLIHHVKSRANVWGIEYLSKWFHLSFHFGSVEYLLTGSRFLISCCSTYNWIINEALDIPSVTKICLHPPIKWSLPQVLIYHFHIPLWKKPNFQGAKYQKGTIRRGCLGSKLSTQTIKVCLFLFIGSRQTLIKECFLPTPNHQTTEEAIYKEKLIFGRFCLFILEGPPQYISSSEATLLQGKFLPCLFKQVFSPK